MTFILPSVSGGAARLPRAGRRGTTCQTCRAACGVSPRRIFRVSRSARGKNGWSAFSYGCRGVPVFTANSASALKCQPSLDGPAPRRLSSLASEPHFSAFQREHYTEYYTFPVLSHQLQTARAYMHKALKQAVPGYSAVFTPSLSSLEVSPRLTRYAQTGGNHRRRHSSLYARGRRFP